MRGEIIKKMERVLTMADCVDCFADPDGWSIVDVVHPVTGLTMCYGKTLEQVRAEKPEYANAEKMTLDEFCERKAKRQRTPITWEPTTAERFDDMLCVLPPEVWIHGKGGGFLVGEAEDHDAGNGQPRFSAFRMTGEAYETANRPLTVAEFKKEMQERAA